MNYFVYETILNESHLFLAFIIMFFPMCDNEITTTVCQNGVVMLIRAGGIVLLITAIYR